MNFPIVGDGIHHMWDLRLVIDMFLGGAGVGAFILIILASFYLGWDRFVRLRNVAVVFAPVALAISLFLLFTELTQTGRAYLPYLSFQPSSAVWWGSWIQLLFLIVTGVYAVSAVGIAKYSEGLQKILGAIGVALGIAVIFYHGFFLADFGRAVWAVGGIPILFPIASIASGAAVLVLLGAVPGSKDTGGVIITRTMVWGSLATLLATFGYLFSLSSAGTEAQAAAELFMSGRYSTTVWFGVFTLGALGVVLGWLGVRNRGDAISQSTDGGESSSSVALPLIAAVLVLLSIFMLRYVIVIGGQTIPLLPIT